MRRMRQSVALLAGVAVLIGLLLPRPARTGEAAATTSLLRGGAVRSDFIQAAERPGALPQGYEDPTRFFRSLVALPSGALQLHFLDVSIPDDVAPLTVTRTYDSSRTTPGVFGTGWSSNLDAHIATAPNGRLVVVEPDGTATVYEGHGTYAADPSLHRAAVVQISGGYRRRWDDGVEERFDARGRLVYRGDAHAALHLAYDGTGRVPTTLTDARGHVVRVQSDGTHVVALVDPLGRTSRDSYDGDQLVRTVDAAGRAVVFAYGAGLLQAFRDPAGTVVAFRYDAVRRLTSAQGPGYLSATYTWQVLPNRGLRLVSTFGGSQRESQTFEPGSDARQAVTITYARGDQTRLRATVRDDRVVFTNASGAALLRMNADGGLSGTTPAGDNSDWQDDWRARIAPGAVTAANGSVGYDAAGRPLVLTLPDGTRETWTWDVADRVSSWTDPAGVVTAYRYDALNHLAATQRLGRTLEAIEYNGAGLPAVVHRDRAADVHVFYTRAGQPALIRSAGRAVRLKYDAGGQLVRIEGPDGSTDLSYDVDGRLNDIRSAKGRQTLHYDAAGRLDAWSEGSNEIRYLYGTKSIVATAYSAGHVVATERLAQDGTLLESRDVFGDQRNAFPASTDVDRLGRISASGTGNDHERYTYDVTGRLNGIERAGGRTTIAYLPDGGSRTTVRTPAGTSVVTTDAGGHTTMVDDGAGTVTRYGYDDGGALIAIAAPGLAEGLTYDVAGDPLSITETTPQGVARTTFVYDPQGRLVRTNEPDGTFATRAYDSSGNLVSQRDRNGVTTSFAYDAAGLLRLVAAPDVRTQLDYDADGRLVRRTSSHDGVRNWTYDAHGETRLEANGERTVVDSDAVGNPVRIENAAGGVIQLHYNAANQIDGYVDPRGKSWTIAHGSDGAFASFRAPSGTLVRVPAAVDDGSSAGPLRFSTAASGRLTTIAGAPDGDIRYKYNALGETASVSYAGATTTYAYDAAARISKIAYPNGITVAYAYALCGAIASETYRLRNGPPIYGAAYLYDASCRLISSSGSDGPRTYAYDTLHRLVSVRDAEHELEHYAFDAAGNMFEDGARRYAYDDDGRIVDPSTAAQLDDAGRLQSVRTPAGTFTYAYDGSGRVAEVRGMRGGTHYIFAGDALVGATDISSHATTVYVPGVDGAGWAQARVGAQRFYPIRTPLGSLVAVTDERGRIVQRYNADAFGGHVATTGPLAPEFDGRPVDLAGLVHFGARAYAPELRRFVQPDPDGFDENGSLYAFALNDPLNVIDQFGAAPGSAVPASGGVPATGSLSPQQLQAYRAMTPIEAVRSVRGGGPDDPAAVASIVDGLSDIAQNGSSTGGRRAARDALDALANGSQIQVRPGTPQSPIGVKYHDDPTVANVFQNKVNANAANAKLPASDFAVGVASHELTHTTQNPKTTTSLQREWEAFYNQAQINRELGMPLPYGAKDTIDLRSKIISTYVDARKRAGQTPSNGQITDDMMFSSFAKDVTRRGESYVFADVESNVDRLRALRAAAAAERTAGAVPPAVESGLARRLLDAAGRGSLAEAAQADAATARVLNAVQSSRIGKLLRSPGNAIPLIGTAVTVVTADNWTDRALAVASLHPVVGTALFAKSVADSTIAAGRAIGDAAAQVVIGAHRHFIAPFEDMFANEDEPSPTPSPRKKRNNADTGAAPPPPPPPGGGPPPPAPFPDASTEPAAETPVPGAGDESASPQPAGSGSSPSPSASGDGVAPLPQAFVPNASIVLHCVARTGTEPIILLMPGAFPKGPTRVTYLRPYLIPCAQVIEQPGASGAESAVPPNDVPSPSGSARDDAPVEPAASVATGPTAIAALPQTQERPANAAPAPAAPPPAAQPPIAPPAPAQDAGGAGSGAAPGTTDASPDGSYRPWWWNRLFGPPAVPPDPPMPGLDVPTPGSGNGGGNGGNGLPTTLQGAYDAASSRIDQLTNWMSGGGKK